jgi:hypothetical protein
VDSIYKPALQNGTVRGLVEIACSKPPEEFVAVLTLQRATGKRSADRVYTEIARTVIDVAPGPTGEVYRVTAPGEPGRYRTQLVVSGVSNKGRAQPSVTFRSDPVRFVKTR